MNPPNKHILAIITYLALVPLVYFIPLLIAPYLPVNNFLQVCINLAIIVPVISYLVMPFARKILLSIKKQEIGKCQNQKNL